MAIGPVMQQLITLVNDQKTVEAGIAMSLNEFVARFQAFVDNSSMGAEDEAAAQKLIDELTESEAPLVAAAANIPPVA